MVFLTIILARTLDSLVRVTRRVDRNHFVKQKSCVKKGFSREEREPEMPQPIVLTILFLRANWLTSTLKRPTHLFVKIVLLFMTSPPFQEKLPQKTYKRFL